MIFCSGASHGSAHNWEEVQMVRCRHCGQIEEKCPKSSGPHQWKEATGKDPITLMEDWGVIPGFYCIHCDKKKEDKK